MEPGCTYILSKLLLRNKGEHFMSTERITKALKTSFAISPSFLSQCFHQPSIAQLVERWTVVDFPMGTDIHRSLVQIRFEGKFFGQYFFLFLSMFYYFSNKIDNSKGLSSLFWVLRHKNSEIKLQM